jgi:sugar transferase (PEP-CTERM/EpsH1 system associated)
VEAIGNGVNAEFFSPEQPFATPYSADEVPIVFTGAMDYWPNVDAATWFVSDVLPSLIAKAPSVRFTIVGMRPTAAVQALARDRVVVTGTVPDVRPYLAHARVVVAPLRVARGVQNKVLEAMAMGRPVVASAACAGGIDATLGSEFAVAASAPEYVEQIVGLLDDRTRAEAMGAAARVRVLERYSWDARLSQIDRWLPVTRVDGQAAATEWAIGARDGQSGQRCAMEHAATPGLKQPS